MTSGGTESDLWWDRECLAENIIINWDKFLLANYVFVIYIKKKWNFLKKPMLHILIIKTELNQQLR